VIISFSTIIYLSKERLHQSADNFAFNAKLSSDTQDLLSSLQKLEIYNKRFILRGNRKDSVSYVENLDSLKARVARLGIIIENQPKLLNSLYANI